jgi:hypothetical protein
VLEAAGGFDERWEANEDGELSARIAELGYRTMFVPLVSAYRVKRGPLAAIKQWGAYGYWRAQTLRRHPQTFRLRHLAPPLAIAFMAALLLTPLRPAAAVLYALYVAAIWAKRERGEAPLVTLAACVFFPAAQAAWGIGLLRGLAGPRVTHEPIRPPRNGARGLAQLEVQPVAVDDDDVPARVRGMEPVRIGPGPIRFEHVDRSLDETFG